ncbi:MAG: hypothetical protein AB7I50_17815, partial [Vicinamibacterales bacterium]
LTVWPNVETWEGLTRLANTDVSTIAESMNGVPFLAEQSMYLPSRDGSLGGGVAASGATAPALQWYFAEGATAAPLESYLLIANPDAQRAARVRATYWRGDGASFEREFVVEPLQRYTVAVAAESFAGVPGQPLANAASVAARVTSDNGVPIVAERSVWWAANPSSGSWTEGHRSFGMPTPGTSWAFAEGEVGGPQDTDTYVLVLNASDTDGSIRVKALPESGSPVERTFPLQARARVTVSMRAAFPELLNTRFGLLVSSLGASPAPIVVERSMYTNDRVPLRTGTASAGVRLQ